MITLHHCVSARSFRALWTLEELGLPYRLAMLPFPPRALARSYLELNPLGTVPLLQDGAARLTESAAICEYLVRRYGRDEFDVTPEQEDFDTYLNALHFGEATLTFPQTLVLRYRRFETPDRLKPEVADDYERWFLARLRAIDAVLKSRNYLCRKGFTVADISVGYALMLAEYQGISLRFSPTVQAYWTRLKEREAYQRALQIEGVEAERQGVSSIPSPLSSPPVAQAPGT